MYLDRINADGALSNITQITIAVRFSPENLQIADFDGDGLTDILFGTPSDSLDNSRIQVAWNLGGLRFSAASSFGLPKHDNIGSADLDGDGAYEIVGLTRGILSVVSFRNREIIAKELQTGLSTRYESGGLQFSRGGGPSFVGFDDRDGDGWKDLVFLGADGFLVLWGAPGRPFETSSAFFLPRSWKATLLDLDGDGLSDMVPLRSYPDGPRIVWGTTGTRDLGTSWDLSFEANLSRDKNRGTGLCCSVESTGAGVPTPRLRSRSAARRNPGQLSCAEPHALGHGAALDRVAAGRKSVENHGGCGRSKAEPREDEVERKSALVRDPGTAGFLDLH